MEIHHFQWVNPLFLWSFSIAMLVTTRGYKGFSMDFPNQILHWGSSAPSQPWGAAPSRDGESPHGAAKSNEAAPREETFFFFLLYLYILIYNIQYTYIVYTPIYIYIYIYLLTYIYIYHWNIFKLNMQWNIDYDIIAIIVHIWLGR